MIPYIDSHTHMHSLAWDTWELLGMCGMRAAVISAGTPYLSRATRTEVPGPREIEELWRQPIQLARTAPRELLFDLYVSIGISHATRVREWERLLERMPAYFQDPLVVAVGEMGLDPFQVWGMTWTLEEQEEVLKGQLQVAKAHGKPFMLHTPSARKRTLIAGGAALPEDLTRLCLERDLRAVEAVGFPQDHLVVDHCDAATLAFVLQETKAYAGISVGLAIRDVRPQDVAEMVARHGPERILLNSDLIGYTSCDPLGVPASLRAMRRLGLPLPQICRAAFGNANAFYGLGLALPSVADEP
ncbi:MAG: TatD family hydrolase [Candidatus Methylomirabilales bacterium]